MSDQEVPQLGDIDIPSPRGLRVTAERPYHLLIVSDLAGPAGEIGGPLKDGVVDVNAESFDEIMASAAPSISFTTTDPFASGNKMVEIKLSIKSLKDFDPENIATQIPVARPLMTVRKHLVDRMHGKADESQVKDAVASAATDADNAWLADSMKWAPGSAPAASEEQVDDILGQIDLGDGSDDSGEKPKSPLSSIVSAAAEKGAGGLAPEESSAIRRTIGEIDRRVSAWLNKVLHAKEVQPVEAAWRSLAFLVSHMEFRKGVRLSVLHAALSDAADRFVSRVIDPVFDEGADAPETILLDYGFSSSASDLESLDTLAQNGASLPAMVFGNISPAFFGVKQTWQIATLPPMLNHFDQWQFAKYKTLRGQLYANYLGIVFGRALLRAPHGHGDLKDLAFHYREDNVTEKDFLWANGVIAVGCTIAASAAKNNWPTQMSGFVNGRVEDFKTAEGGKKGDKKFGPTDTDLPQPKIEELAAAGLNAVVGFRDSDDAIVWNGLTTARPKKMDPDGLLQVSLPYQLFASRLSTLLFELKPHLAGMGADAVTKTVRAHVQDWLSTEDAKISEEDLRVQVGGTDDDPNTTMLAVTVTPPPTILPGAIPVVVGYKL